MIIALLNQKGGVGKTTLALHLAAELTEGNREVMLVDADPQGSALDWAQRRQQLGYRRLFGVVGLARETLHQEVPEMAKSVHHVVIDGPPRVTALTRSAMLAADVVLIPVQPSPYDIWGSAGMVELLREAMVFRPKLKAALLVSRKVVRTVIGRQIHEVLDAYDLPVLNTGISQRIAFAECAIEGQVVREMYPRSAARGEIALLALELRRMFL